MQKYVTTIYLVSAIEVHIGFEAITNIVMRLLVAAGPPLSTVCALYARPSKDHNYLSAWWRRDISSFDAADSLETALLDL